MSTTRTRMDSATRRDLILSHNVKPVHTSSLKPEYTADVFAVRAIGRKACSKMDAILSRRRELGLVK